MSSRRTLTRSPVTRSPVNRCRRAAVGAMVAVTVAVVASSTVASEAPVLAGAGVGIDPGDIGGLPALAPSESTTVSVVVRNPGSAPADYEMVGQPLGGVPELPADPTWFTFDPATFTLAGGETQEVTATLTLPDDVEAGEYLGLLTAQLVLPEAEGSGARVGAAVATRLRFTVESSSGTSFIAGRTLVAVLAIVAIAAVAVVAIKRSGIRVTRRSA